MAPSTVTGFTFQEVGIEPTITATDKVAHNLIIGTDVPNNSVFISGGGGFLRGVFVVDEAGKLHIVRNLPPARSDLTTNYEKLAHVATRIAVSITTYSSTNTDVNARISMAQLLSLQDIEDFTPSSLTTAAASISSSRELIDSRDSVVGFLGPEGLTKLKTLVTDNVDRTPEASFVLRTDNNFDVSDVTAVGLAVYNYNSNNVRLPVLARRHQTRLNFRSTYRVAGDAAVWNWTVVSSWTRTMPNGSTDVVNTTTAVGSSSLYHDPFTLNIGYSGYLQVPAGNNEYELTTCEFRITRTGTDTYNVVGDYDAELVIENYLEDYFEPVIVSILDNTVNGNAIAFRVDTQFVGKAATKSMRAITGAGSMSTNQYLMPGALAAAQMDFDRVGCFPDRVMAGSEILVRMGHSAGAGRSAVEAMDPIVSRSFGGIASTIGSLASSLGPILPPPFNLIVGGLAPIVGGLLDKVFAGDEKSTAETSLGGRAPPGAPLDESSGLFEPEEEREEESNLPPPNPILSQSRAVQVCHLMPYFPYTYLPHNLAALKPHNGRR